MSTRDSDRNGGLEVEQSVVVARIPDIKCNYPKKKVTKTLI